MQEELARLQTNNSNLSETVSNLRAQIAVLERENVQLKRNSRGSIDWDSFDMSTMDSDILDQTYTPPDLKTELSNDSGVFDVSSSKKQSDATVIDADADEAAANNRERRSNAAMIVKAITDAAANLQPPR